MKSNQSQFTCECGKSFTEQHAFSGHKSHCKTHHIAKYGNLDIYENGVKQRTEAYKFTASERREAKLNAWINEKHTCKNCGKVMTEKYGEGIYCCAKCRAVYTNTHRKKLASPIICDVCGREFNTKQGYAIHRKFESGEMTVNPDFVYSTHQESYNHKEHKPKPKVCVQCGAEFPRIPIGEVYSNGLSYRTKFCSVECKQAHQHRVLSDNAKRLHKEGVMKSFTPRNNIPESEQFWMNALSNADIVYIHDYRISHIPTEICSGYWFMLDFFISKNDINIDLEIDGKQHKYLDRAKFDVERDRIVSDLGYIIYRVDISDIDKSDWQEQFNKFMLWYESVREQ